MGRNKRYYVARAIGSELGITDSGKEHVSVSLIVEDGQETGRNFRWDGYFTEKTIKRTMESLRYMGWASDDITALGDIQTNPVQLVVEDEEYEGKTYAKVQWVNQIGGVSVKNAMDDGARKAFAARVKGAAIGVDKGKAAPVQYTPQGTGSSGGDNSPPPPTDDDFNF